MNKLASLFIAFALALGLFHELRITGFPRLEDSNNFSWYMFASATHVTNSVDMPTNWHSRTVGCAAAGVWFELWGRPLQFVSNPYINDVHAVLYQPEKQFKHCDMIGSYYAFFYFITCIALVAFLKNPILPMLGTFAGILCCSPDWMFPYLLPWDLPTMTIWTVIFLFYLWLRERPALSKAWMGLALLVIFGGLFKETVLVTALFFLGAPWRGPRRIVTLLATILISQILNWIICGARPDWLFSVHEGTQSGDHRWNPLMLWPVLFANAGSIALLPWALRRRWQQNRHWPIILVCTTGWPSGP